MQSLLNIINQSYSRLLFISQAHARTPFHDVYICAVFNIKRNQIIPSNPLELLSRLHSMAHHQHHHHLLPLPYDGGAAS